MCRALEYAEQIANIVDNIQSDYVDITKNISICDARQQDLLHIIELTTFNAANGYKLAKELQDIRTARRNNKNELETMNLLARKVSDLKAIHRLIGEKQKRQLSARYHMRTTKTQNNEIVKTGAKKPILQIKSFVPNAKHYMLGWDIQIMGEDDKYFDCIIRNNGTGGLSRVNILKKKVIKR